jgi:hypothetical protein
MKTPATLAWVVLALLYAANTAAETCEFPIKSSRGGDRSLTMTKSQYLQSPVDRNRNSATVYAALLDFDPPQPDEVYVSIELIGTHFVETRDEAEAIGKDHSDIVPEGLPLMINFTDDTSELLTSWGMYTSGGGAAISPPGFHGNDTGLFRVSFEFHGSYLVDAEQRSALMAKPVRRIQMTTSEGDYVLEVTPNRSDRFKFVLGCLRLDNAKEPN